MSVKTSTVGGFQVGRLGYGLMNLTIKPVLIADDKAFEAIKTAIDGGSNFLNSGEFYGRPEPTLNLQLLSRFYAKYPEYINKTFLSVKGGLNNYVPDASEANLRKSVNNINEKLGGQKKMDLFEMGRVDPKIPIEETMRLLETLKNEGHFKHIGLSEVSAATIRKASAVTKIAAVEVEYSPFSLDIEKNGVLAACKELNIPIIAYSPLGRGFLSGTLRKPEDIPAGDPRHMFDRFKPENFGKNLELVDTLSTIAAKKGVTPTQLTLAWCMAQWEGITPIPGSTRVEGVKEAIAATKVQLSPDELKEIRTAVDNATIVGGRYNAQFAGHLEG